MARMVAALQRQSADAAATNSKDKSIQPTVARAALRSRTVITPAVPLESSSKAAPLPAPARRADPDIAIYRAHFDEARTARPNADLSRIDSEAALAMRITGHSKASVQSAVHSVAQSLRTPPEARDWAAYSERVTTYAFGVAGSNEIPRLKRHEARWKAMELSIQRAVTPIPETTSDLSGRGAASQKPANIRKSMSRRLPSGLPRTLPRTSSQRQSTGPKLPPGHTPKRRH
jgi:hypothetical protein